MAAERAAVEELQQAERLLAAFQQLAGRVQAEEPDIKEALLSGPSPLHGRRSQRASWLGFPSSRSNPESEPGGYVPLDWPVD